MSSGIRLQKFMAMAGVASRRQSERIIAQGRVAVNGCIQQGAVSLVNPDTDTVELDGRVIDIRQPRQYYKLNKPAGYITTLKDPGGRPTVLDLIDVPGHVFPVGRLDKDSTGLLIFTNDGELAQRLMRPESCAEKEYQVFVTGHVTADSLARLRGGMSIYGYRTRPAQIELIKKGDNWEIYTVILREGKKRQIRRMFGACGHKVLRLYRKRIGPIETGNLKEGEYCRLSEKELKSLCICTDT